MLIKQDVRTGRLYKLYDSYECEELASSINVNYPVAESNNLLLAIGSNKELVISPCEYKYENVSYSLTFKTAEYHSYVMLRNEVTGDEVGFGVASTKKGAFFSKSYLRDDTLYDQKYFKNCSHISHEQREHLTDWGVSSIRFIINKDQAKNLKAFLVKENQKMLAGERDFNLFYDNCHVFSEEVFDAVFETDIHLTNYIVAEEMDLNDKGLLFLFMKDNGIFNSLGQFYYLLNVVTNLASGKTFSHIMNNVVSSVIPKVAEGMYQNTWLHTAALNNDFEKFKNDEVLSMLSKRNYFGDTALHLAVQKGNFAFAEKLIELGANCFITNHQGLYPGHYVVSAMAYNHVKAQMFMLFANLGFDFNTKDVRGDCYILNEFAKTNNLGLLKQVDRFLDFSCQNREGFTFAHAIMSDTDKYSSMFEYISLHHKETLFIKDKEGLDAYEYLNKLKEWEDSPKDPLDLGRIDEVLGEGF